DPSVKSFEEHKSQEKTGQPAPPPPPPPPARKKSALFQGANGLGLADELRARAATRPISVEGGSTIDQQLAAAASRNTSPSMARDPAVESILARRKAIDDDGQGDNISDSGWSSSDDEHDSGASSKPSVTGMFGGSATAAARAAPPSLSPAPSAGSNG
ncbi:MAG: hypothetical protein KBD83_05645, partial [Gammaproteobacteria bacterium]|nr:hypothetical protein [Gammaproteobacteria bacterium]